MDLFENIPEENVKKILKNIKNNIEKISCYEGHMIEKHSDVQLLILQTRLKTEDIRYATSFYSTELAKQAIHNGIKEYFYQICQWLLDPFNDKCFCFNYQEKMGLGYGYKKNNPHLYENISKVRIVMKKSLQCDWGVKIITAYPIF